MPVFILSLLGKYLNINQIFAVQRFAKDNSIIAKIYSCEKRLIKSHFRQCKNSIFSQISQAIGQKVILAKFIHDITGSP